jgi:hypothetical protein
VIDWSKYPLVANAIAAADAQYDFETQGAPVTRSFRDLLDEERRLERKRYAQVMYAYIKDRAAQYEPSSGIFCALNDELAPRILDGDAYSAYEHGELDDLMEEYHERTRRRDAALCR